MVDSGLQGFDRGQGLNPDHLTAQVSTEVQRLVKAVGLSPNSKGRDFRTADVPTERKLNTYDLAIKLLATSDLSTAQLRERLTQRQFPGQEIEDTIVRLINSRILDDNRTALSYARRSATIKLRGRRRTHQELQARGIGTDVANQAVTVIFDELGESEVLERAITKRLHKPLKNRIEFRRLHRFLVGQGFPSEAVSRALISRTESNVSFVEE